MTASAHALAVHQTEALLFFTLLQLPHLCQPNPAYRAFSIS